jgi:hypothetical protein
VLGSDLDEDKDVRRIGLGLVLESRLPMGETRLG